MKSNLDVWEQAAPPVLPAYYWAAVCSWRKDAPAWTLTAVELGRLRELKGVGLVSSWELQVGKQVGPCGP